ncbi:hypothetical protein [Hyunsoonleella rubra]|uniref:Uncharacterized protein n=1 Tax=Hyunsoonleella rubra TaxID=1737062 RepID=A0ABW5T903_9FLAO
MVRTISFWALPQGSGFPLYLFKASLRGAQRRGNLKQWVSNYNLVFMSLKKDATTIPNAPV